MRTFLKKLTHRLVEALEWCIDFRTPRSLSLRARLSFDFGSYEPGTTRFFRRIAPHGVVFDIGAHIGYYSRIAAKTASKVYAFEPDPENFALLKRNARNFPNVIALNMAVGDTNGPVTFYKVPNSTFRHSLVPEEGELIKTTVECTTLDSFVATHAVTGISLIKIDVEQAEPLVFKGAQETLKQRPIVVFESLGDEKEEVEAIAPDGSLVPLSGATYHGSKRKVTNVVLRYP